MKKEVKQRGDFGFFEFGNPFRILTQCKNQKKSLVVLQKGKVCAIMITVEDL